MSNHSNWYKSTTKELCSWEMYSVVHVIAFHHWTFETCAIPCFLFRIGRRVKNCNTVRHTLWNTLVSSFYYCTIETCWSQWLRNCATVRYILWCKWWRFGEQLKHACPISMSELAMCIEWLRNHWNNKNDCWSVTGAWGILCRHTFQVNCCF